MKYKSKSKKRLEERAKFNKGKRVGYARGDSVEQDRINVDKNIGMISKNIIFCMIKFY